MYGDAHALCKHIYPGCPTDAQGTFGAQVNTNKAAPVSKNHVAMLLKLFNSRFIFSNLISLGVFAFPPAWQYFDPTLAACSSAISSGGYLVSLRTDLLGLRALEYHLKILFQSNVNGSYPLVRCKQGSVVISGSAKVHIREQIQVLTKGEWQRQSNETDTALEGSSFWIQNLIWFASIGKSRGEIKYNPWSKVEQTAEAMLMCCWSVVTVGRMHGCKLSMCFIKGSPRIIVTVHTVGQRQD